ncbi:unnamed protein product, partial [Amoebophrya sp. A25]|eukprot:GSA25T00015563001.1
MAVVATTRLRLRIFAALCLLGNVAGVALFGSLEAGFARLFGSTTTESLFIPSSLLKRLEHLRQDGDQTAIQWMKSAYEGGSPAKDPIDLFLEKGLLDPANVPGRRRDEKNIDAAPNTNLGAPSSSSTGMTITLSNGTTVNSDTSDAWIVTIAPDARFNLPLEVALVHEDPDLSELSLIPADGGISRASITILPPDLDVAEKLQEDDESTILFSPEGSKYVTINSAGLPKVVASIPPNSTYDVVSVVPATGGLPTSITILSVGAAQKMIDPNASSTTTVPQTQASGASTVSPVQAPVVPPGSRTVTINSAGPTAVAVIPANLTSDVIAVSPASGGPPSSMTLLPAPATTGAPTTTVPADAAPVAGRGSRMATI